MAQAFDLASRKLTGEPIPMAESVGYSRGLGYGAFSLSDNGMLAYQGNQDWFQLLWYDRRGSTIDPGWDPQSFGSVRLSPDAQQLAVDVSDPDVYVMRTDATAKTRISVGGGSGPRRRRDGKELYYAAHAFQVAVDPVGDVLLNRSTIAPVRISSPSCNATGRVIAVPFTKVPFLLSRSSTVASLPVIVIRA